MLNPSYLSLLLHVDLFISGIVIVIYFSVISLTNFYSLNFTIKAPSTILILIKINVFNFNNSAYIKMTQNKFKF